MRVQAASIAILVALTVAIVGIGPFNCSKSNPLVSGVSFSAEPNLETVKVQLNFGAGVKSDLGGSFAIKDYGAIEVQPWTPRAPFNVGFRLNTEVLNDQDFLDIRPITNLPSGDRIPTVNRAMAQIKLKNELNPNFDVSLYVDVLGNAQGTREWVGVALTFNFLNNTFFPAGLSISQNFLQDAAGNPRASVVVFGPRVNSSGFITDKGGIAMFANIAALLKGNTANALAGFDTTDRKSYFFDGPLAPYYEAHPSEAYQVGEAFRVLLNANARN